RIVEKRIGKITLAKANRNSSPTYSLVLFAPSHSLRMGDFFRKDVKERDGGTEKQTGRCRQNGKQDPGK
ncbi:hypothetical protein P9214_11815, partial [Heyndrickxia coagulans]|uniref:hypothetical protein n=1 Tax=Heyndrickxia coagulans TaxID=1398 RepID=UPI002E1D9723|nr:hypothetical protein [Heyndrickxia coagulans]